LIADKLREILENRLAEMQYGRVNPDDFVELVLIDIWKEFP